MPAPKTKPKTSAGASVSRAPKTSIYLGEEVEKIVNVRGNGKALRQGDRSEVIRAMIVRYDELCARHRPSFSAKEWRAICDGLGGVELRGSSTLSGMVGELEDAERVRGIGKAHGVDVWGIVDVIRKQPYAGRVAIADVVECYWAAVARGAEPHVPGGK